MPIEVLQALFSPRLTARASRPGTCYIVCTMPRRPFAVGRGAAANKTVRRGAAANKTVRRGAAVRSAGWSAAAIGLLCAVACASPTLPLPPPEAPTQTPGVDAAHVHLSAGCGGAEAGADIIIINQTQELAKPSQAGVVSLASGCGAWDAEVLARTGDTLSISQESDNNASTATIYMVR